MTDNVIALSVGAILGVGDGTVQHRTNPLQEISMLNLFL